MPTNVIINGSFDVNPGGSGFGWSGNDLETTYNEDTYLGNGNTGNSVAEMNGNANQVTVMEQSFVIADPLVANLEFDVALRNASKSVAGEDGYTVEILDASGTVIFTETILPTNTSGFVTVNYDVTFAAAGTYTLRFTEVDGDNDSYGALVDDISLFLCITNGAEIATPNGPVLIEDLAVGDMVTTQNGPKPIRWIGTKHVTGDLIQQNPKMAPIRIQKSALSHELPTRDLWVSRQHRMVARNKIVERMFDLQSVLVSAVHLTKLNGIDIDAQRGDFTFFHLLFDEHEVIYANGAPTESLLLGEQALKMLSQDAIDELTLMFPDAMNSAQPLPAACAIPQKKRQKTMVQRLAKNQKPVFAPLSLANAA